jgi:hypothetical protein
MKRTLIVATAFAAILGVAVTAQTTVPAAAKNMQIAQAQDTKAGTAPNQNKSTPDSGSSNSEGTGPNQNPGK